MISRGQSLRPCKGFSAYGILAILFLFFVQARIQDFWNKLRGFDLCSLTIFSEIPHENEII